jgi:hypothetical protein
VRKSYFIASLALSAVLGSALNALAAPVIVFDDSPENGFGISTGTTIDASMAYQGSASLDITPAGGFNQQGFTGSNTTPVPVGATTFQMAIYVSPQASPPSENLVANFVMQVNAPTYASVFFNDSNSNLWTIDGAPGTTTFTPNAWHIVTFDLAGAFSPAQLTPGTTRMLDMFVQTNGDLPQADIHLDSAEFVSVPEPASISLLGMAAVFGLRRYRKPAAH